MIKTSETIDLISEAMAKAQAIIKQPIKDKHVDMTLKSGRRVKYSYADLASVIECVRKPFAENKLFFIQGKYSTLDNNDYWVETRIGHASGQWMSVSMRISIKTYEAFPSSQEIESGYTYFRRYQLSAFVGIHSEDDDDGLTASEAPDQGMSKSQATEIMNIAKVNGYSIEQVNGLIKQISGKTKWGEVPTHFVDKIIKTLTDGHV